MNKIKSLFGVLIPALLVGLSVLSVAMSMAAAVVLTIDEDYYFVYEDANHHKFKCYNILDDETGDDSVSIAWFIDDVNNPYPSGTLEIPANVSDGSTNYKVKSIARAGFRRCTSTSITVPNGVLEIKEEAFAYCQNITDFTFPYSLDEIAPSTFLDCRNLTTLAYRDNLGNRAVTNETITKIGNHAFDSCVKLKNFYCPTTVTEFGNSCFQKCESIVSFFFPVKNADINNYTNNITVKSYAFADCSNLNYVYFEENMTDVEHHAFADCNSELRIHYTGSTTPQYRTDWRKKKITPAIADLIPIITSENEIRSDTRYPGLYYTTETENIKLDSAGTNSTSVYFNQNAPYAKIYKFDAPFESIDIKDPITNQVLFRYYDVDTGALQLPNTIDGKPLKVINENTFQNHTELRSVKFNADLVQIKHGAFYHCTNIENLDFSDCTALKEISYDIFQEPINPWGNEVYNTQLHEIHLPACLEYIGEFAFYNFLGLRGTNAISFGGDSSQLKVIGGFAFAVNSKIDDKTSTQSYPDPGGSIDLVLPCSLSDSAALAANYMHIHHDLDGKTRFIYLNTIRPYAIGTHAFDNQKAIKTVTMKECSHTEHKDNDSFTTSLASNVFVRCINMFRFKANKNLCYIGKDTFKSIKLKELFLTTEKAERCATYKYPWGIEDNENKYGETLFWGAETKDAVVYVTGSTAPKSNDTMLSSDATTNPNYWNANSTNQNNTYHNELRDSNDSSQRSRIPTYYSVDYFNSNSIVYWKPTEGGGSIVSAPSSIDDYNEGIISFVKGTDNKYTVARYYCDSDHDKEYINLTNITGVSNNLTTIGEESFGSVDESRAPGLYIVLPNTVTTIAERAFFRNKKTNGVRIVTYKDNSTIATPSGNSNSFETIKDGCTADNDNPYLCMPTSLTRIERSAFYNNRFKSIDLSSSLRFIGNSAFYTHAGGKRMAVINGSFSGQDNYLKVSSGAIYYDDQVNKILVYQPSGVSGTLNIEEGTVAVGMRAVTNTKYTKFNLPSTLTTIYGGGFQNNDSVTEVYGSGVSHLVYISTMLEDSNQVYKEATHGAYFDNFDHRKVKNENDRIKFSRNAAFKDCTKLDTLNFRDMTSVKYIGPSAFQNCKLLKYMSGGNTYSFYHCQHTDNSHTGGTTTPNAEATYSGTEGVLDLTNCSNLRSIAGDAFAGCSAISYIILPDSNPDVTRNDSGIRIGDSLIKYGIDGTESKTGAVFGSGKNVLVGETISQAWPSYNIGGINNHISSHYNSNSFKGCTIYYYAEYQSDISNTAWTGIRYWTKKNGNYILYDNGYQAYDDLPAYSTQNP